MDVSLSRMFLRVIVAFELHYNGSRFGGICCYSLLWSIEFSVRLSLRDYRSSDKVTYNLTAALWSDEDCFGPCRLE